MLGHDDADRKDAPSASATPVEKISVARFAPPPDLAPYIWQFYHFRCDETHVQGSQPAALGHLSFLIEGEGGLTFSDRHFDPIQPATIMGPGLEAAKFMFRGPFENFGLALTSLGFVALTGKSAADYADRVVAAETLIDPAVLELAERFRAGRRDGNLQPPEMVAQLSEFLRTAMRKVPDRHVRLIAMVTAWVWSDLNPDVGTLYKQLPVSRSTASRLIAHYFGSSPKLLACKYRALRAAAVLVDPQATDAMRTWVESVFYDQPHMIREIRQFTGCTPGALDGHDARFLRLWLSKDNFRSANAYPG